MGARKLEMGRAPMQYRRTNVHQKCYTGHKQCTQCAHTMQCAHTIKYNSGCEHKYGNCTVYSFFYRRGRFMANWPWTVAPQVPTVRGQKRTKSAKVDQHMQTFPSNRCKIAPVPESNLFTGCTVHIYLCPTQMHTNMRIPV